MEGIRQPIVVVLGHVDHGKTSLLDKIRGTAVALREAGGITQHVGASFLPTETLVEICNRLPTGVTASVKVPGVLVIDTPGHEAFMNLRRRGGSIADIAILVIDVLRGVEPQTVESMEILRNRRTPFLVALNKIDAVPGWRSRPDSSFTESYRAQEEPVRRVLDDLMYRVMGELSRQGFNVARFDEITDFRRTVAVVPVSAKTGEGIPELVAVLVGLVQQFMVGELRVSGGAAKGSVLEVKEEPGMGVTINAVIYDGVLRSSDIVVVGGLAKPIVTRIRALLVPKPLDEMRDPRDRFLSVGSVSAAAGVKIAASGLEEAVAGAPIASARDQAEAARVAKEVEAEVEAVRIRTEKEGVVVKADALGSLEALVGELTKRGYSVRLADVGDVSKRDVSEASVSSKEAWMRAVLAFNVKALPDAEQEAARLNVPIFRNQIIYRLIEEDFIPWSERVRKELVEKELSAVTRPAVITLMPGYVFRRSNPAIAGFRVEAGTLRPGVRLLNPAGMPVGEVQQIQDRGKSIPEAVKGMEIAVSIDGPTIGRQVMEGGVLYVDVPEQDARLLLTKFRDSLDENGREALQNLIELKRRANPLWGY